MTCDGDLARGSADLRADTEPGSGRWWICHLTALEPKAFGVLLLRLAGNGGVSVMPPGPRCSAFLAERLCWRRSELRKAARPRRLSRGGQRTM